MVPGPRPRTDSRWDRPLWILPIYELAFFPVAKSSKDKVINNGSVPTNTLQKQRKFKHAERAYAKQVVKECIISRFTVEESVAYLNAKLKRHDIIDKDYYRLRVLIKDDTEKWMQSLMKDRWAYVAAYKERLDEYIKYQKEYWLNYHSNPDNGFLRIKCLDGLQNTSAAITQLYDIVPEIAGGQFESVKEPIPKTTEETTGEIKATKPTAWVA